MKRTGLKLRSKYLRKRGNGELSPSRAGDWRGERGTTKGWSGGESRRPSEAASFQRSPSLEAPSLFPMPTLSLHSLPPLLSTYALCFPPLSDSPSRFCLSCLALALFPCLPSSVLPHCLSFITGRLIRIETNPEQVYNARDTL